MNSYNVVKTCLLVFFVFSSSSKSFSMDTQSLQGVEKKINKESSAAYYVVCTPGAEDNKLREELSDSSKTIVGLNLQMGYNLKDYFPLSQMILHDLQYLKLRAANGNNLKDLPSIAPNLKILDMSSTNFSELESLTYINSMPFLRVLDISDIPFSVKIPEYTNDILSCNKDLKIYIKSLRKKTPKQDMSKLSDCFKHPRVISDPYYFDTKKMEELFGISDIVTFIY